MGRPPRPLDNCTKKSTLGIMNKRLRAVFYKTPTGHEPVRDWLKGLAKDDRKLIGEDILTVEIGWPIGMPTCRPLGNGIFEVRTNISSTRIARVLFYVESGTMFLLHCFIKKTQKTPIRDLDLATKRMSEVLKCISAQLNK